VIFNATVEFAIMMVEIAHVQMIAPLPLLAMDPVTQLAIQGFVILMA